jgi:serine/threonine protein kinase
MVRSADLSSRRMTAIDDIPEVGSRIAQKYEIERVLGAGGMGVVVAARHVQLGQRVAIKFLRAGALADPAAGARFLREAQAAVALTSDHVTKVLDVGELPSGAPFMVMEYLAGVDLAEHLRTSGTMAIVDAIDAVLQACEAIAEAHALGIIHRDLKPANLFVTRRIDGAPFVKVLDFGISKTSSLGVGASAGGLTATGFAMGSPSYMSPEQIRNAKAADPRSDVWSMGVILYQLLTGVAPFAGETIGETFARIMSDDPVPVRQLRPEVPEGLAATIAQCLERSLDRRVQTIAQLAMQIAPFGAPDALIAAQRVVHIARSGGIAPTGSDTLAAPSPVRDSRTSDARAPVLGSGTIEAPVPVRGSPGDTTDASNASRPPSAWQQSGPSPVAPRPRARAAWAGTLGGATILILGFAVAARLHPVAPESEHARAASSSPQGLPDAAASSSTTRVVVDVPPLEDIVAADVAMPIGSLPDAGRSDAGARRDTRQSPSTAATTTVPPPSKTPPKPNCDPSYTLDETGQKHFKPECFR